MMQKTQTFEFSLVLDGVDEKTPSLEDGLFEAGCDDALINFRHGTVYLDFAREATSLEDAVISAIKAVEASTLHAKVINILPDALVNETEIAERLHKTRQTVSLWVKKARRQGIPFPNPISKLSHKSPMWRWYEVVLWLYQQKIITDQNVVTAARFIETLNVLLEERKPEIKKYRHHIFQKLQK